MPNLESLAMSAITTEILLDAVALLANSGTPEDVAIIDELIVIYTDEMKNNTAMDNGLSRKFVTLLDKLKTIPNTDKGKLEKSTLILGFFADPIVKADDLFYKAMKDVFDTISNSNEETKLDILSDSRRKLIHTTLWNKANRMVKRMYGKLSACNLTTDIETQEQHLNDVINIARELVEITKGTDRLAKGCVERVDMSDPESVQQALARYRARKVFGILKTGLKGLDKACGRRGGLARGESVCIYALLHNFKSGLLMTIARGIVCFNDPPTGCKGKPTVLFISLENEANENMMWFYKTMYEGIYRESSRGKTEEEIIAKVQNLYADRGWNLFVERWEGTKFDAQKFIDTVEAYEAQGFEIVVALVDYASKMKKGTPGSKENKRDDLLITDLFNELCTFTKTRGILFITAHQLNREAMKAVAGPGNNHVKKFTAGFAGNSIGASQEIDLELFVHLETNHLGTKYLTVQRGKHRYVDDTPEAWKYFAYPFTEFGIVSDEDIEEQQYVTDIYAVQGQTEQIGNELEFSALL